MSNSPKSPSDELQEPVSPPRFPDLPAPRKPRELGADTVIGDTYRLTEVLAHGSSSIVYVGKHMRTELEFAIKVLQPPTAGVQPNAIQRFFREAALTAQLASAHTVRVLDFGRDDDDTFWLAMELLDGETLSSLLLDHRNEGIERLPPHLTVSIADGVLCSLIEAHACALVHRDLRPSNIFLHHVAGGETVVKLFDFGVVKDLVAPMSGKGESFGQVSHMAPEQLQGRPIDGRADLYSLGVVLYECLTGTLPFEEHTDMAMAAAHIGKPLVPIIERTKGAVSGPLAMVVERALAKRPDDRWRDAVAMRDAVLAAAAELSKTQWKRFDSAPGSPPLPSLDAALGEAIWAPAATPEAQASNRFDADSGEHPQHTTKRNAVSPRIFDTTPGAVDVTDPGGPRPWEKRPGPPSGAAGEPWPDTVVGPLPTESDAVFSPEIKPREPVSAPGAVSGGMLVEPPLSMRATLPPDIDPPQREVMSRRPLRLHLATTDIVIRRDELDFGDDD